MQKRDEDDKNSNKTQQPFIQTQFSIHSPVQNGTNTLDASTQNQLAQQLQTLNPKRKYSQSEIKIVQSLIERCLRNYMSENEAVINLHVYQGIEPSFVSLVWRKLEEQNPEFFRAYSIRLKVKEQINTFNTLINQQAQLMQKKSQLQKEQMKLAQQQSQNQQQFTEMYQNDFLEFEDFNPGDFLNTSGNIQSQPQQVYVKQEIYQQPQQQPVVKNVKISQGVQPTVMTQSQQQQVQMMQNQYPQYYVPQQQQQQQQVYYQQQYVPQQQQQMMREEKMQPMVQQKPPVVPTQIQSTEGENPSTGLFDLSENPLGIEEDFDPQLFLPFSV